MPILKAINNPGQLAKIIRYCNSDGQKNNRNDYKGLTNGINCSSFSDVALKDMLRVKKTFNKIGGRQYQHFVLSFSKEEFIQTNSDDYPKALDYAIKLSQEIWGDRYQVFLALHTNSKGGKSQYETQESQQGCLHVHIVINSVSYIDGTKIQSSADDLCRYRDINDNIAREHGFTVLDRSKAAVKKRGRIQIYDKDGYQQYMKSKQNPKAYQKLQATVAIIKTLEQKPENWDNFQILLKEMGWDASVRGHDVSIKGINTDNQKYTFRLSSLAKSYNNQNITPYNVMQILKYPGYETFKKRCKPWKQQCADDIMFIINQKKPKKFEGFVDEMDQLGWLVVTKNEHNIIITRKNYIRKSGKPVRYSCNRLATDYENPMLCSQLIMQAFGESNYLSYAPRQSPIASQIEQESASLAQKLAAIANQEQQIMHQTNKMVVELESKESHRSDNSYSISW